MASKCIRKKKIYSQIVEQGYNVQQMAFTCLFTVAILQEIRETKKNPFSRCSRAGVGMRRRRKI